MAELHSKLYYQHPNPTVHSRLKAFIEALGEENESILLAAQSLNFEVGEIQTQNFLNELNNRYQENLHAESTLGNEDFWISQFLTSSCGDYLIGKLVKLLYDLCPGVRAQAWGYGDHDTWEFWYKYDNGRLLRCEDELSGESDNERTYNTIYRWWHEQLPAYLQAGLLNEGRSERFGHEYSDDSYFLWLEKQKSKASQNITEFVTGNGMDYLTGNSDAEDAMSAFGHLFSAYRETSGLKKNPQEDAFDATQVTREKVLTAFRDIEVAYRTCDINGVLKHFSPRLTGTLIFQEDGNRTELEANYTTYKFDLGIMLKPQTKYQSTAKIHTYILNRDGTASLGFTTVSQYIDPQTRKLTRSTSEDEYKWAIIDSKLQIVEMNSKQVECEEV
ncbi:hypothetical protein BTA51_22290 [Hahella sp. CCB-MM4]|uniref:hypothetical protein n=1 Tax=Hahella sp. (strain CCB-MM4) TaxID=1926491 RepID=UPI000B9C7361|nr:hypothetical protein [Hahella sp. CCB-MM4]OZG71112.1 hypothetical protein BTA51_22290 [Hahella sp. CCB-MM4]